MVREKGPESGRIFRRCRCCGQGSGFKRVLQLEQVVSKVGCSGGWLGVLCVLKDGSGGPDAYGPQLCSRGTLKWPDGRNHVGEFCQGLEHG